MGDSKETFACADEDNLTPLFRSTITNEEEISLFIGSHANERQVLISESFNSATLDIACSSTVFREDWLNCYLQSLNSNKLSHVKESESDTNFKLGCGTTLEIEINNKSNISLCSGGGRSARLVQPRHLQQPYNAKEMGMMQEFRYFTAW